MSAPPRLRIAPSPTGYLHVGTARTALFNWLVARREGGTFILRIEDTDTERNVAAAVEGIQSALRWLGLDWDEGPYFQSQRAALYADAAAKLAAAGAAYWCECSFEDVQARARARGGAPGYDGRCRDLGLEAEPGRVLRFRTPRQGTTTVVDLVRGEPTFDNATIEDFTLVKSNGAALFLLANVVDDIDMRVSLVVRGEDHLPNTPKYQLLWEALGGGPLPRFAHLPLLVNEQRKKLSKRRDKVALEDLRDEGYLPEVMVNYLALLGWGPADGRERLSLDDLLAEFRLEDVLSSPAVFDRRKLDAFNAEAIRALPTEEFLDRATPWLLAEVGSPPWPADRYDPAKVRALAGLAQERVTRLDEVPALLDFVLLDEPAIDEAAWAKEMAKPHVPALLDAVADAYRDAPWEADALKEVTAAAGESLGLKLRLAQAPVRVAVTGRTVGLPLFESLVVLGRAPTLQRLAAARARVG